MGLGNKEMEKEKMMVVDERSNTEAKSWNERGRMGEHLGEVKYIQD